MNMNLDERIEAGRSSAVAVSLRAAAEMIGKVETGEYPVAYLSGPGGCGKTYAALPAIRSFEARGLPPLFCNPSSYRDIVKAMKDGKVYKDNRFVGRRLLVMEEADVIFRSDKSLNLLKIATDRSGTGNYNGVDVRMPMVVTTNAPLEEIAAKDRVLGEHIRALFNRVPPVTISYDRRANYDYAVSLALTTDLLRFTPAKRQISRDVVARSLHWFTEHFNSIELLTARTLGNAAEYLTSFSPETADAMLQRFLLPDTKRHSLPIPPQSDWVGIVNEVVDRKRAARGNASPLALRVPAPRLQAEAKPLTAPSLVPVEPEPYWVDLSDLAPLFSWGGTAIGWTGHTLNCIVGCEKVSRACKHCYAAKFVARGIQPMHRGLAFNDRGKALWTGEVRYDPAILRERPLKWGKKPSLVFFTSLSDPFHRALSVGQIQEMLDGCAAHPNRIWQWLTKRPERAAELAPKLRWPSNIWIGATIEEDKEAWRADALRQVPVATKFISAEPLAVDAMPNLDLTDISWLIVGGESGPGAEPMHIEWARSLRDRAVASRVPFFFKQWGAHGPSGLKHSRKEGQNDTLLDGREWFQFPRVALDHGLKWSPAAGTASARV